MDFWAALGGPKAIRRPEINVKGIVRILRILGLLLLPKKDEKFTYKYGIQK